MHNPLHVPITPPRVPLIDVRTGTIAREWYLFFLSLYQVSDDNSTGVDYLQSSPTPQLGTMAPMNKEFMDYIGWNQNAGVVVQPGQMAWNSGDGCLDIGMGYDAVVQQVGLETYYRIKASATINNGDLIMFTGAVGASGVITGAPSAIGLAEGLYIMGIATMDIPNNDFGYVTAFGLVRGINTTGASVGESWSDGDILYYNPAYVGGMTNVRPTSPAEVVVVAAVTNAGPGGSGSLFVRPSFYPRLGELSNVYTGAPSNGQTIIYNQSTGRWEGATLTAGPNVSITNGAGSITIAASTTGATGSVTLAKITSGGANGSLTFSNGLITAYTAPT